MTETSSRDQLQLALTAAVSTPPAASEAWQKLMDTVGFYDLSTEAQRLTPAIYTNLQSIQSIPERNRLRGAFKHAWSKNHRILHELRPVLTQFNRHNIAYRVIKGIALQLSVGVIGNRVVGDADLLVDTADIDMATQILTDAGFTCNSISQCGQHSSRAPTEALDFHKGSVHVDVHVGSKKQPARLLAAMLSQPPEMVDFYGVDIAIPPPTLLTLHSVFHGTKAASPTDFIQALVDIVTLTAKRPVNDLVDQARRTGLLTPLMQMNRRLENVGWRVIQRRVPWIAQLLERLTTPLERTPGVVSRAVFLWRIRFPGWAGVRRASRIFPGKRWAYAQWLLLGQFEFLERLLTPVARGFLRTPKTLGPEGLALQPIWTASPKDEMAVSPVACLTQDYRMAVSVPAGVSEAKIYLTLDRPATEKAAIYVNGEQLLHWYPGQKNVSCSVKKPPVHLEVSIRPSSDVCRDCFSSLQEMQWSVTLVDAQPCQ